MLAATFLGIFIARFISYTKGYGEHKLERLKKNLVLKIHETPVKFDLNKYNVCYMISFPNMFSC
jgi:hypothetical protein